MKLEIKNKFTKDSTVQEFLAIKRELVQQLAAYMIENDLVEVELKRGTLVVTVEIKKCRNVEM
ncbi:MAG: hypothetical protein LBT56_00135 [Prevotellaceae bacterium]|jgi:hypothetical protein|nr:hypothetical protein [Prevotellaceae bacterium]